MIPIRTMFSPILPVRPIKRVLVFVSELGVLVVGIVLSLVISFLFAEADGSYNSMSSPLASATLITGWALTVVCFLALRRKTGPWKIAYDAVGWELADAERRLHPVLSRRKRIAKRVLLWVPSTIAAFVLLFLPVASHLLHPHSQYLRHYLIPVPWNVFVFSSFGPPAEYAYVQRFSSRMLFGSIQPDADTFEFNHHYTESLRDGAVMVSRKEFRLGVSTFTCWQSVSPNHRSDPGSRLWDVRCETPVTMHRNNLYAWFVGNKEDIPAFYRIVQGIVPLK
jgi:hypothetical protein